MYGYAVEINVPEIFDTGINFVIMALNRICPKEDCMKPNHHSLAYKQQKQPNKTYKDLKQKQKMKIADWMFRETCIFYKENGEIPNEEVAKQIIDRIYEN